MTFPQRVALSRVMSDLIKSDNIIDMSEIDFFLEMQRLYKLEHEHLVQAQKMDFGAAVNVLKELSMDELKELMVHLRRLMLSDGNCAPEEAFMILAIEYCLNPDYRHFCRLITTSITSISIDLGNIVYTETEYDEEINQEIKRSMRSIVNDFSINGLEFVYIPNIAQDFKAMKEDYLHKTIDFLAPTITEERREYIYNRLRNITTKEFCDDFLVKRMGLNPLYDSEPSILFQVCRSNGKIVYMQLPLGVEVIKDLNEFVDVYSNMVRESAAPHRRFQQGKRFVYHGFHRALFDLLAFPGQKIESTIVIDPQKRSVLFNDLGEKLLLPTGQLALYVFLLHQSVFSNTREIPIDNVSPTKKQSLERIFKRIYGMMSDNPSSDYLKSLSPNLAHIRRAIKDIELLDGLDMYLPERKNGVMRLKLNPSKIFVVENGTTLPMAESKTWKSL